MLTFLSVCCVIGNRRQKGAPNETIFVAVTVADYVKVNAYAKQAVRRAPFSKPDIRAIIPG